MKSSHPYAELALFKGMTPEQIDVVIGRGLKSEIGDGQVVISQGDPSEELFCVLAGGVEVLRDSGSGPRSVAIIKPGHCFGEIGFFAGERRTAMVRTIASTETLSFNRSDLDALIASDPAAAALFLQNIITIVAERFAEMHTNLASMVFWLGN